MVLDATAPSLTRSLSLAWSGGKDSALALWTLREREGLMPASLMTTVTAEYERISMHGVRRELLARQAQLVGVPLVEVEIPVRCTDEVYDARMVAAFASEAMSGVEEVAFGDLFLSDVREYRESRLAAVEKRALFPVWGLDTADLARRFISLGFRAVLAPDHVAPDPIFEQRTRYYMCGVGPSRWLLVVVSYEQTPARIVSAFANRKDPKSWSA
jgi:hypothetical protein